MLEILVKKLREHLYRLEEAGGPNQVHAYLICGQDHALMVDGLWLAEGLLEKAKAVLKEEYGESDTQESRIQKLSMLITHGHEDHAGKGMEEFLQAGCKVYLSQKDWFLLGKKHESEKAKFTFLKNNTCLDLGQLKVQIREMPGHTPGSLLAWVPQWNTLFTSDAIGAGVLWMQLPECSFLSQYKQEVEKLLAFLEKEKERAGEEVQIYPGHAQQIIPDETIAKNISGDVGDRLTYRYVREVLSLTQKILDNPQIGEPRKIDYPGLEQVSVRSTGKTLLYDYCYDENAVEEAIDNLLFDNNNVNI